MRFLQKPLYSFEELLKLEPNDKLSKILLILDHIQIKDNTRNRRGPKGYARFAFYRAFLAMKICSIPTVVSLRERLLSDLKFKHICGFDLNRPVPSKSTFSRAFSLISTNDTLEKILANCIEKARNLGIIESEIIAIDATNIKAYEVKQPKKDINQDGTKADWGAKRDSNGNQLTWFGYKLHIAVDAKSECPVAIELTPASIADGDMAIPLIEKDYHNRKDRLKARYFVMDSGYDQSKNYKTVQEKYGGQAIIPLNPRNEKQPPAGYDFNGTPICSAGYKMVYWGGNKFRCPHILGKVDCPFGSNWCSSSDYGMVVKTKIKDDPRRFCNPHRDTKGWKEIYNKRTAVERTFGRLKEHFGLNNFKVQGFKKVYAHILLSCISLVAANIAVHQRNCKQKVA